MSLQENGEKDGMWIESERMKKPQIYMCFIFKIGIFLPSLNTFMSSTRETRETKLKKSDLEIDRKEFLSVFK